MGGLRGVRLGGYRGTWYEVDKCWYNGVCFIILESEIWGEDVEWLAMKESEPGIAYELDRIGYNK